MKRITMLLGAGVLLLCSVLFAAVPQLINFQGILRDGSGNPVANGSYSVQFTIYDAPVAGANLWTETQSVNTTSGLFAVELGTNTPLTAAVFSSGADRYLGITVNSDPEVSPRTHLNSVAYAYLADNAAVATLAQELTCSGCVSSGEIADGSVGSIDIDATQVQRRVAGSAPFGAYLRQINQDGSVVTGVDANSVYTAGTGLVLNGGTQFAIANDGVTATQTADEPGVSNSEGPGFFPLDAGNIVYVVDSVDITIPASGHVEVTCGAYLSLHHVSGAATSVHLESGTTRGVFSNNFGEMAAAIPGIIGTSSGWLFPCTSTRLFPFETAGTHRYYLHVWYQSGSGAATQVLRPYIRAKYFRTLYGTAN